MGGSNARAGRAAIRRRAPAFAWAACARNCADALFEGSRLPSCAPRGSRHDVRCARKSRCKVFALVGFSNPRGFGKRLALQPGYGSAPPPPPYPPPGHARRRRGQPRAHDERAGRGIDTAVAGAAGGVGARSLDRPRPRDEPGAAAARGARPLAAHRPRSDEASARGAVPGRRSGRRRARARAAGASIGTGCTPMRHLGLTETSRVP